MSPLQNKLLTSERHCGIFGLQRAPPRNAAANPPGLKEHADEKRQASVR